MGVLGNLDAYSKLKSAEAIQTAAANPGLAGAGIGMGVGFGMGNQMGHQMMQGQQAGQFNPHTGMQGPPAAQPPPPPAPGGTYHYNGPGGQAQLSLAEVVSRVAAARDASHHLWQPGWPGWKPWSEVPEVASQAAAPPPAPGATVRYHYNGAGGQAEKTAAEVIAAVLSDPSGKHHVWQNGWSGWKAVSDVPELAAELAKNQGPPPPPP